MKTRVRFAIAAMLAIALVGCGGTVQQTTADDVERDDPVEEPMELDGGWQVNSDITGTTITPEQAEVFQRGISNLGGVKFEAIALIGQQLVAGMNYAYLCKATPAVPDAQSEWDVVVIYEDLEGNVSLTSAIRILLSDVQVKPEGVENADGAWEVPAPTDGVSLPGEADAVFDAAMAELSAKEEGFVLAPQALLGTQVVAGTNYQVLCIGAPIVEGDLEYEVYDLTIYQDLDGNVQVTSMDAMDLGYYVTPVEVQN